MKLSILGFVTGLALGATGLTVIAVTPDRASSQCAAQAVLQWSLDLTNHQISISGLGVTAVCQSNTGSPVMASPSFSWEGNLYVPH